MLLGSDLIVYFLGGPGGICSAGYGFQDAVLLHIEGPSTFVMYGMSVDSPPTSNSNPPRVVWYGLIIAA